MTKVKGMESDCSVKLVDALFLVLRLVNLTVQADRTGKLHEGHKLFRITQKAQNRYRRIRAEFQEGAT